MAGTVTWAGLDVHARSTHAAAINVMTGELVRAKFGAGLDEPLAWLVGLPGPVKGLLRGRPDRLRALPCRSGCGRGDDRDRAGQDAARPV